MTSANKTTTNRARKSIVAGLVGAIAIVGILAATPPRPAYANDGTPEAMGMNRPASHYEGEKVTISPGNGGGPVYAEWTMVDGEWCATFITYNGNRIVARPAANEVGWTFWVLDNGANVEVIRTAEEGAGQNTQSHWQEVYGIKRY